MNQDQINPRHIMRGGITIVTGTDTDAGKTVTTAVLARALVQGGDRVRIIKPYQTGCGAGEPADVDQAGWLAGLPKDQLREYVRCPEPLAPTTSAARAHQKVMTIPQVADQIMKDAHDCDATMVEGAGGVLVGLDNQGRTVLDLMDELSRRGARLHVVVATRAGLGTLNHTGLTCHAITGRGHTVDGIVIGAWPAQPDLAAWCNLEEIAQAAGAPLWGVIPTGIGDNPQAVDQAAADLGSLPQQTSDLGRLPQQTSDLGRLHRQTGA